MTNQSSILNEHDLKELARMAMNIILEKYIYILRTRSSCTNSA